MRGGKNRVWPALLALTAISMASTAAAAEIKVSTKNAAYSPKTIAAKVGDVLRFENDDTTTHAVFVPTRGFGVHLGDMAPGKSVTLALPRAGAFEVECVFHSSMLLKVTVTP